MLYKRSKRGGAHWWVRFELGGHEIRRSSKTHNRERAEKFERDLRDAWWDEENLGIEKHTWEEACERWLKEKAHKRSLDRDRQAFRHYRLQGDITGQLPERIGEVGAREQSALRALLRACVRWGWLDKAPKVEMPHEEKHDPRWITQKQFARLAKELPPHAAAMAKFAVATGLRSGNICGLKWEAVDLKRRVLFVGARDAKTRKSGGFPLSPDALAVLRRQSGLHQDYVFTDHQDRAPIGSIKTCWAKACKRANLAGFRFHDLRHTWAAWHTLEGTPPIILKELGGWSSLSLVERYSHLNPGHLADWADNSRTKAVQKPAHGSSERSPKGLKDRCSTWRMSHYECVALPTELLRQMPETIAFYRLKTGLFIAHKVSLFVLV